MGSVFISAAEVSLKSLSETVCTPGEDELEFKCKATSRVSNRGNLSEIHGFSE